MNRGMGQPTTPTSFQVGLPPVGASGLWWVQARPGAGTMWNYFTTAADATNPHVLLVDPPYPTQLNVVPPPHQPSNTTGSWIPAGPSEPTKWIWYPWTVVSPGYNDTASGGNAISPDIISPSSQMVGGDGLTYSVYAQARPNYSGPIDSAGHPTAAPFPAPTSPPQAGNMAAVSAGSPARWLNPAPNYYIWVPGSATAPGVYTPPPAPVTIPGPGSGGSPYLAPPPAPITPVSAGPSTALVVVGLVTAAAGILGIAYLVTRTPTV
jgi:hypothetical protein